MERSDSGKDRLQTVTDGDSPFLAVLGCADLVGACAIFMVYAVFRLTDVKFSVCDTVIEIARQNGKYKGRKPIAVDGEKFAGVYRRWKSGEIQGVSAMRELDLKPSTFYRRVRDYENSECMHKIDFKW